ncbi:MAG: class I SAM-dependent methyltransferase [Planctomycetota bacterium]
MNQIESPPSPNVTSTLEEQAQTVSDCCENCGHETLSRFEVEKGNCFLVCPQCLLYQKREQPPLEHYESNYHTTYASRRNYKILTALTRLGALTKYLDVDHPKMLDVGCSIGATVEAAVRLGWDAHGVDVSKTAVQYCVDQGLQCQPIDGLRLPFEDNSFDVVTSWHVIEHVEDVKATLAEWYRVVKPGGILVLETPDSQCWKARRLGTEYKHFWPFDHLYTFTRSNMCSFLETAGFEVLPSRVLGKLNSVPLHVTAYALAYRSYRKLYRTLGWCKSIEVCARKV